MSQRLFNLEHQIAKLQEQINLISEENSKLRQAMQEAAGDPPPPRWQTRQALRYWGVEPRYSTRDSTKFRGYVRRPTPESAGKTNLRAPAPPATTYRPSITQRLPTPKPPFFGKGANAVVNTALTAYAVGTAIDQIMHGRPGVPKDQLRPAQTEQLPSPESLYPAPSNAQSSARPPSGGQGSGGGLSG